MWFLWGVKIISIIFVRVIAAMISELNISFIHHCVCLLFSVVVNNSVLFSWDNLCATSVHMHGTIHVHINHEPSRGYQCLISPCSVNILSSEQVTRINKILNYGELSSVDALPNSQNYTIAVKELGSQWRELILWVKVVSQSLLMNF